MQSGIYAIFSLSRQKKFEKIGEKFLELADALAVNVSAFAGVGSLLFRKTSQLHPLSQKEKRERNPTKRGEKREERRGRGHVTATHVSRAKATTPSRKSSIRKTAGDSLACRSRIYTCGMGHCQQQLCHLSKRTQEERDDGVCVREMGGRSCVHRVQLQRRAQKTSNVIPGTGTCV